MLIRSQNKNNLITLEMSDIEITETAKGIPTYVSAYTPSRRKVTLGSYHSEDRAVKVVDELVREYALSSENSVFQMPAE